MRPPDSCVAALRPIFDKRKIKGWSETVKRLGDEDTAAGRPIHVILLGSSPLLVQQGLTDSLTGRFELIHFVHRLYSEMKKAFNFDVDTYIFYCGYPGAAELIDDEERWGSYIRDSFLSQV